MFWYGFIFLFIICNGLQSIIQCNFLIKFSAIQSKKVYYFIYITIFYGVYALGMISSVSQNVATLTGIAILYIFVNKVLKQNHSTSIVISTLAVTANVLVESITQPMISLFLSINSIPGIVVNVGMGIIMLLLTYVFLCFFSKRYNLKSNKESKYLLILVLPLIFISIVMRTLLQFDFSPIYTNNQISIHAPSTEAYQFIGLALIAFLCICGSLFAYEKVIKYFETEKEKIFLETQLNLQKNYIQETQLRYDSTRAFRHDLKNHIIALHGLLERDEIQRALDYLQHFEISEGMYFPVNTGNTVIDILLSEKLAYAKKTDINVKCDVMISKTVKIDDFDLCAIFSNAVDNAIRACNSIKKGKKVLDIAAKQNRGFFIIDIINNYEYKKVPKGTGIGISTIKMIAQKYLGAVEITDENSFFRISILLPLNENQKDLLDAASSTIQR